MPVGQAVLLLVLTCDSPALEGRRVQLVNLLEVFVWCGGQFLQAEWTTDIHDLAFNDGPFRFLGKIMLHHRTDPLCPSDIGVDGRPVLRIDLALDAAFAAEEDRLLADVHLDRWPMFSQLQSGNRTNGLDGSAQFVALG